MHLFSSLFLLSSSSYEILHESLLRAAREDLLLPALPPLVQPPFGVLQPLAQGEAAAEPEGEWVCGVEEEEELILLRRWAIGLCRWC